MGQTIEHPYLIKTRPRDIHVRDDALGSVDNAIKTIIITIDRFTDRVGILISWLAVPLVAVVMFEVVSRYAFNAPTLFAFDMTYMLYGALFMLGAGPALLRGAHIRTDFFWDKFSPKTQGWIDLISYLVFFFPSFGLLFLVGLEEAVYAYTINETSDQTPWRPLLWPFKFTLPIACSVVLLQGISECLKSWIKAKSGLEVVQHEKVEV